MKISINLTPFTFPLPETPLINFSYILCLGLIHSSALLIYVVHIIFMHIQSKAHTHRNIKYVPTRRVTNEKEKLYTKQKKVKIKKFSN